MRNKLFWRSCVLFAILAVSLMGAGDRASAEDIASFYRGKIMRIVVAVSPGGGQDTYARLLAPLLEKRLGCKVVVINKPGGGGLVAMNDIYQVSRTDGLTLAMAPEGIPLAQAIGATGVRFDNRKFGWLASLYKDVRFLLVGIDSPYKTVEDLKKLRPAKVAVTAVTSAAGPTVIAALEALNISNAKIVAGYPGSTEVILAVKRGEADFTVMSITNILKKDPLVRGLVVIEDKRVPEFPDVPAFTEYGVKPEVKRMLEIITMGQASGRAMITPPGVSKEKITFLRKVIDDCIKDPQFVKNTRKVGLPLKPLTGEKVAVGVEKALNITPEEVKNLKHIMFEKYF